jgi:membrane fusion protein (multidrug efflux system)
MAVRRGHASAPLENCLTKLKQRRHQRHKLSITGMVRATHRLHCAGPLAVGLTLTVALAACGQSKTSSTPFLSINTATISQGSFKPSIKAISPLESTTNVALSPETDGRVIKKLVKEGDQVQAGQVILVLDNTQLSAQLDASKSEALYDKVNAERYQFLY